MMDFISQMQPEDERHYMLACVKHALSNETDATNKEPVTYHYSIDSNGNARLRQLKSQKQLLEEMVWWI
jgi:hypothetical protein